VLVATSAERAPAEGSVVAVDVHLGVTGFDALDAEECPAGLCATAVKVYAVLL
jgi:hypothetical protein